MLITPLILTWNEAPNIARTLAALPWAEQIVVVDSGSDDGTLEILSQDPRVRTFQRAFDNHADQWNFGVQQVPTPWVLALDADFVISDGLGQELVALNLEVGNSAWYANFHYLISGRPLRGTLYPPHPVLFLKERCRYYQDGHTQKLEILGPTGRLGGHIDHDDRKPLRRWFESQVRYASLEAEKLTSQPPGSFNLPDRIRLKIWPAVPLVFVYTLLAKGCLFDGWRGWYYTLQRCTAEALLSLELLDRKLRR